MNFFSNGYVSLLAILVSTKKRLNYCWAMGLWEEKKKPLPGDFPTPEARPRDLAKWEWPWSD